MTREQVIKALEQHTLIRDCTRCPYIAEPKCRQRLLDDALALLKEQTSVKPVKSKLSWGHGYNWDIWDCGHCGSQLRGDANYCDRCGHKVNWDDMEESDA